MALKDTIEIKFSAKGDDVLIQTIKKLDQATKALVKVQSQLVNEGKKQVQSQNKNANAIKRINTQLAIQGSNWKKAGISAELYTKAVKGNAVALGKVRVATKKHIADLAKQQKGMFDSAHATRILGGSFAVLRSKMLIVSFAIMLIERTVVSLVKAFAKQEAVNKKLQVGLANISDTTEGVTQRLINYSSALQQTTAFGDEMITNGMAQLTTFGLNEEAIKSLTPQVLNVARAIQTTSGAMPDLNSLFIAFGKSTSTAVSALTEYGVVLTDTEKAQLTAMGANERAGAIAKILDKQYGGLAEAYAKTTMGMLESASAARGDAAEAFGEVLAPAVLAVSKSLKSMSEAMSPENIKAYGTAFALAGVTAGMFAIKIKDVRKAMQSLQALATKNWVTALIAVLGLATGVALDYFDVFEDGEKTLTDAEKRMLALKKEIEENTEAQKELIESQESGAESLQKQLDLLNATSEAEKMRINLGHEASTVEEILILKIVKKQQAIEGEEKARKEAIKTYKSYLEALRDEINLRLKMSLKTELAHLDLLGEKFKGMKLEGNLTESNAQKLLAYTAFNKQLISTFSKRVQITKDLNQAGLEQGIALDLQDISIQGLTESETAHLKILIEIFNQQQKNLTLTSEELSLREQLIGSLTAEQEKMIELQNIQSERANLIIGQVNQTTSAITSMYQAQMRNEIDALKKTSAYRNADAERRKDMEDKIARNYAKKQKKIFLIDKAAQLASVYVNTSSAMMKAVAAFPLTLGEPWKTIIAAMGVIQAGAILATPAPQAFAKGGEFVTSKPEMIMVGEAGREHVKITPIDRPDERALKDGGLTINFNNAIMSSDFTRDQIIPQIQEAVRLNLA